MRKLLTLVLLLCFLACQSESGKSSIPRQAELITPSGDVIKVTLLISPKEQEQGLSGVKPQHFDDNEGMFFFYLEADEKHFWMPDTYFDLDIIFLSQNLKIIDIIRKLPHYVGRANPGLIPRARGVWARHALEMKASSEISKKLKIGDQFKWKASLSISELEEKIRNQKN